MRVAARRRVAMAAWTAVGLTVAAPGSAQNPSPLERGHAAAAAGDLAAAWEAYRTAYVPAEDDPRVLAALASTAERLGRTDRFLALVDSVLAERPDATNALLHWGAAALRVGVAVDSVAAAFERRAARSGEGGVTVTFARVLSAHGANEPAEGLLVRALESDRGSGTAWLALGDVRATRGDEAGALEAYAAALAHETAAEAAARIGDLVDGWIEDGDWDRAVEAVDPLPPGPRAARLRETARRAEEVGAMDVARAAAERLVAMGSPWSRASDRRWLDGSQGLRATASRGGPAGLLAEVEAARATGDGARVEAALERARAGGVGEVLLAVPAGDLWLARGDPDSALAAYARAADPATAAAVEALARLRLVRWLAAGPGRVAAAEVGQALVGAPADPAGAARVLEAVAGAEGDSLDVGGALLLGLAGEWRGRGGDPRGASAGLEAGARRAPTGEAAALLLASARWADAAGETSRARDLWREVALEHADTPYALEARRLLAGRDAEDGGVR